MKRKALIISSEFPPLPGGIGNHAYHLSKQLAKSQFDVQVLTNSRGSTDEQRFKIDCKNLGIQVKYLQRYYGLITYVFRFLSFTQAMSRLRKHDLLIASGKFSILALGILKTKARKLIVVHGTEIRQEGLNRTLFNQAFKRADIIVCVSNYSKKKLLEAFNNLENKIEVINNGFELETELSIKSNTRSVAEQIQLITVGNMTKRKGQHNVIKALKYCKEKELDVIYHVIGIPTNQHELVKLAIDFNVQDQVIFHGTLSNNEKIKLLQDSDIFIMLSEELPNGDFEGFGIAILEANAIGLPAIGSRNSGIADAIDDGQSGILVDPHEPSDVCKAVSLIVENYTEFSEYSRIHSTHFSWDKIGAKYLDRIKSILE
ncbi:glycosyltransferase family 4 protein [bacterium]|nr:glycosyltransferase family 4 protein [bacterium]